MRIVFTGRHRVAGVILPFAIAGITSLLAEAGQTLIPQRCASYTDMVMHGIGTLIGVALASPLLFFVRRASSRLKISLAIQPQRTLFLMVASLVVIAKLAPFDFTIASAEFAHSLATARWSPFDAPTGACGQLFRLPAAGCLRHPGNVFKHSRR